MTKRETLEAYLTEIYRINPEVQGYFDATAWVDNLLPILGVDIITTEKVVIK